MIANLGLVLKSSIASIANNGALLISIFAITGLLLSLLAVAAGVRLDADF